MRRSSSSLTAARDERGGEHCTEERAGLGDGGADGAEGLLVLGADWGNLAGIAGAEIGGEAEEVDEGDLAIAVEISFLPAAGLIEMRGEAEQIVDGHLAVEIEIANASGANEEVGDVVAPQKLGDADGGIGVR